MTGTLTVTRKSSHRLIYKKVFTPSFITFHYCFPYCLYLFSTWKVLKDILIFFRVIHEIFFVLGFGYLEILAPTRKPEVTWLWIFDWLVWLRKDVVSLRAGQRFNIGLTSGLYYQVELDCFHLYLYSTLNFRIDLELINRFS